MKPITVKYLAVVLVSIASLAAIFGPEKVANWIEWVAVTYG